MNLNIKPRHLCIKNKINNAKAMIKISKSTINKIKIQENSNSFVIKM
jgi:hypothetical protein